MAYEIGDKTGDYQILAILGAGGMGKVYKVRNCISDRVEAMKVLLPNLAENKELGERFMREIKLQAALSHPNIAGLHTALHYENQMLMLVEFVDGVALDALIRSGPLPQKDAVEYMAQVLDALAYAHGKGVIHRDLKPANMMLTADGTLKLLDFGIAKMTSDSSLTKTGFLVGSLPYISPEQIEGVADIDGRTDIYSLGVTLYQALTGKVPFQAESEYSLMRKHLQEAPVPPMELIAGVPRALNDIVLKALEKKRENRFQNAAEMASALRSLNAASAAVPTATASAMPPPPPARAAVPPPPPAPAAVPYTPPPAPAAAAYAPPPQQAPMVPEGRKPSNRGLYIALGSVATILVLVVAAIQVPKFLGTNASTPSQETSSQQPQPPTSTPQMPVQPEPQTTATPAVPDAGAAQQATATPANGKPAEPVRTVVPAGQGTAPRPAMQRPQVQASGSGTTPAGNYQPPPSQAQQPPVQRETAQPPAASAAAAPDTSRAALAEAREQLMLLGTRVNAAQASLNRLKQEQARQGLGLRGDIAALAGQVEFYMDECDAAVKRGDTAGAKKYLDLAERGTSKLETFLGR